MSVMQQLYPELSAGGFSRVDGNIEFYGRVSSLLAPHMTVLDFGAGRGKDAVDDPVPYRRSLRQLRGKVACVVGVDIDPALFSNPDIDQPIVVTENDPIPLASESVDLIVSDFVFEHLRDPETATKELSRVLKPGGWICARTPNRWGYIGIGANIVPNSLHKQLLTKLQPRRQTCDVFPTRYALNTRRRITECFPPSRFLDCTYGHNSEPAYFGDSLLANRVAKAVLGHPPESLCALLYVFLQKRRAGARCAL